MKIYYYVYAQTAAYSIAFIVTLFILFRYSGGLKIKIDFTYYRAMLKQSMPFAILILLMGSYKWFDSFILERLLPQSGEFQTGIYAQSFRLLDGISQYSFLFAGLLLPLFSKMIKRKESVEQLTRLSGLLLIIPSIILALSAIFYRHEIIRLFFHQDIGNSSRIFGMLMISFVGISTSYIFGTLLTANGNLRQLNFLAGLAVLINIVLNLILVPRLYAVGSAISNMVTQIFMAIAQVVLCRHVFKFRIDWRLIGRALALIILLVVVGAFLTRYITLWGVSFLGLILTGMGFAVAVKLINLRVLIDIVKGTY